MPSVQLKSVLLLYTGIDMSSYVVIRLDAVQQEVSEYWWRWS